uniref:General vesicular transport factor p115 n=1 Tax=Eptatretus burgeri TaxID=7764 RepID=A0A8C4Q0Z9_EPTBU
MNFLRGVMGAQATGPQPSGAETVQKLCDRVSSSTLLDDRRDAVRALKALSKKYRVEVGTQGMQYLLGVLETDRSDTEIIGFALDTLNNIISNDVQEDEDQNVQKSSPEHDIGGHFTDMFLEQQDNVSLILSLMEEFDFHVRWPAVKLMTALLRNRGPQVQQITLVIPTGLSRMMDLLADSREVIRNDGLLLLQQLNKGNAAIQKIVAFENAFERLLDVIAEEGYTDGGIVVEDCLLLLQSLLEHNSSNQNFFKEGSYIPRMTPWFEVAEESIGWSAQKVTNLHLMLQLVQILVSPTNPPGATASCQRAMMHCELLQRLCAILMATGVPADILTETINTVSEVIRGCQANQEYFASVNAPSTPPRPAIVVLLLSMVSERQSFALRCAILYCLQSSLYRNEVGQAQIVATLLPSTVDASTVSAGQLLCGGLFSADSLSNWCAAMALSHCLLGSGSQREQLLRVQLATSMGQPPVSLLQQCTSILAQGGKLQTRVGLLILLCTWLTDCSIAVAHFLHNSSNIPFVMNQITEHHGEDEHLVQGLCALLLGICIFYNDNSLENYTRPKLKQLLEKRIGKENFFEKLSIVSKHELYSLASRRPKPSASTPSTLLFDYEFTRLVREIEGLIVKAVQKSAAEEQKEEEVRKTMQQNDNILAQYKDLIRVQDCQISELNEKVTSLSMQYEQAEITIGQQSAHIEQLKDQYNLLKVQAGKDGLSGSLQAEMNGPFGQRESPELARLRLELECAQRENSELESRLAHRGDNQANEGEESGISEVKKEIVRLRGTLEAQEAELETLRVQRDESHQGSADQSSLDKDLQSCLAAMKEENEQLKSEKQKLSEERAALAGRLEKAQEEVENRTSEAAEARQEQDDLLVLLADQDTKLQVLRSRLRMLGHSVDDEDDDDDLDVKAVDDSHEDKA